MWAVKEPRKPEARNPYRVQHPSVETLGQSAGQVLSSLGEGGGDRRGVVKMKRNGEILRLSLFGSVHKV